MAIYNGGLNITAATATAVNLGTNVAEGNTSRKITAAGGTDEVNIYYDHPINNNGRLVFETRDDGDELIMFRQYCTRSDCSSRNGNSSNTHTPHETYIQQGNIVINSHAKLQYNSSTESLDFVFI